MSSLTELFATAHQWLFESLVQPLLFHLGLANLLEDAFPATQWLLVGLLQIAVIVLVLLPLQKLWPIETVRDKKAIRADIFYTLIHRLGLFRLLMFFTLHEWLLGGFGWLRVHGMHTLQLDAALGLAGKPLLAFFAYLVVFDFLDYWFHRAQHHFNWWWALHSLHHSQRQMTAWTDNRNHLLDDMLRDTYLACAALLLGVSPGQFVALVALTQLLESLQHANLRWHFGRIGERLLISPRFHRLHHSIGTGHEDEKQGKTVLGGKNFGVLFPWWDMLFGTANFQLQRFDATGVRDQVEQGRDYGLGFWQQQWLGVLRLIGKA